MEIKEVEIEKIITNLKEGIKKTLSHDLDDDALARWASYSDQDSFRQAIRAQLLNQKLQQRRTTIESHIEKHLLTSVPLDVPATVVERQQEELMRREAYRLQTSGVAKEDLEKHTEELKKKTQGMAVEQVKLYYIFEAIAKQEKFPLESNVADYVMGFILSQAVYKTKN